MPWNNQSGGAAAHGAAAAATMAALGAGATRPERPAGLAPDLEDIIRRGQDRLKQALPGGGGANAGAVRR